jgi:hypothetical protein
MGTDAPDDGQSGKATDTRDSVDVGLREHPQEVLAEQLRRYVVETAAGEIDRLAKLSYEVVQKPDPPTCSLASDRRCSVRWGLRSSQAR